MEQEEKDRIEAEFILNAIKKEKLISDVIEEYKKSSAEGTVSFENSGVFIDDNLVIVNLRDEHYNVIATYRVIDEKNFIKHD